MFNQRKCRVHQVPISQGISKRSMQMDRLCGSLTVHRGGHYPGVNDPSVCQSDSFPRFRSFGRNVGRTNATRAHDRVPDRDYGDVRRADKNYLFVWLLKPPRRTERDWASSRSNCTSPVRHFGALLEGGPPSLRFVRSSYMNGGATAGCYAVRRRIGDRRRCVSSSPRSVCESYTLILARGPVAPSLG